MERFTGDLPRQDEGRQMDMVRGGSADTFMRTTCCKIHANGKWEKKKEGRQKWREA